MTDVGDSYFMSYHTTLKKSSDWYRALESARLITDRIEDMINKANLTNKEIKVFPYRSTKITIYNKTNFFFFFQVQIILILKF